MRAEVLMEASRVAVSSPTGLPVGTRIRIVRTKKKGLQGAVGYVLNASTKTSGVAQIRLETSRRYGSKPARVTLSASDVWDVLSTPLDGHLDGEPTL